MDDEIQETVESILGKGVKVVDCEKKSSIREEEVLLINGCPIPLEGEDGAAIREALIHGNVPNCDLLNQILIKAGILKAPVRLETSLSVKSSVVTREEVTVAKGGQIVDERTRETKEDNYYTSSTSEVWEPIGYEPAAVKGKGSIRVIEAGCDKSGSNSSAFRSSSSCSSGSGTTTRPPSDPSTSADSAFFPSDTQYPHSYSSNYRQPSSSSSADSANSFSRDNDFLPPYVNASSSPFMPNCSRSPYIPGMNNSTTTTTTTTTTSYLDPSGERRTTTVRQSKGGEELPRQMTNGFSKLRIDDFPAAAKVSTGVGSSHRETTV
ncbi:UNVERIFIED_CONTAM: hypothetical protein PYX00_002390 [Menopon gallinae]|uniref:Uncharacterized protein n=1 Tax=Menopon gallinae TaxID=328185 RepID=A0AAW2IHH3_9NEOP